MEPKTGNARSESLIPYYRDFFAISSVSFCSFLIVSSLASISPLSALICFEICLAKSLNVSYFTKRFLICEQKVSRSPLQLSFDVGGVVKDRDLTHG